MVVGSSGSLTVAQEFAKRRKRKSVIYSNGVIVLVIDVFVS